MSKKDSKNKIEKVSFYLLGSSFICFVAMVVMLIAYLKIFGRPSGLYMILNGTAGVIQKVLTNLFFFSYLIGGILFIVVIVQNLLRRRT